MMKQKSFWRITFTALTAVFCFSASPPVWGSGESQIGGRVQIRNTVQINQVETGQRARVHLGSVNLKRVHVGGDMNVASRVNVGGAIKAQQDALANVASLQLANTRFNGSVQFDSSVQVNKGIFADKNSDVLMGGISIDGGDNAYSPTTAPAPSMDTSTLAVLSPDKIDSVIPVNIQSTDDHIEVPVNTIESDPQRLKDWITGTGSGYEISGSQYHQKIPGSNRTYQVDIPGKPDSTIKPFRTGTVQEVGYDKGFGNFVVVKDANGNLHRYAHLNSTTLKKGDLVNSNTDIGKMGNTGACFTKVGKTWVDVRTDETLRKQGRGSHLHYDVTDPNGKLVNPETI